MFERHANKLQYYNEQYFSTKNYIIPYLEGVVEFNKGTEVLEVGCGEGGNLKAFLEIGCNVTGIDINDVKIDKANQYTEDKYKDRAQFISNDIYNEVDQLKGRFDLVFLKDTIEHIPGQEKIMGLMKQFLKPEGKMFLSFPPWQMPFGGHQQMCRNKLASMLPYIHLLPNFLYIGVLKVFGEKKNLIDGLLDVKETKLPIEKFERILKRQQYKKDKFTYFLINPNYEVKFKLKQRKQNRILAGIPFIRNFFTTAMYYVVSNK